jgi:Zn-finger nucleic acid-binding protein
MQMTCPKCHGEMRVYERSGVTVDQCTECRGIFLDRGELEKLFEAESAFNSRQASAQSRPAAPQPGHAPPPPPAYGAPAPQGYPPAPGYGQPQYAQPQYGQPQYAQPHGYHGHYRQHGGYHGHTHHKRRKGFLGELFD